MKLQPKLEKVNNANPKDLMRIVREEFFIGDLRRLEPHVDFDGYCLKVTTQKGLGWIPKVDVWLDGSKLPDKLTYAGQLDRRSNELTLSSRINELTDGHYRISLRFGGRLTFGCTFFEPATKNRKRLGLFGPVEMPYSKTLTLSAAADSVVVWAAGRGNAGHAATRLTDSKETKSMFETASWVVAVRLELDPEE